MKYLPLKTAKILLLTIGVVVTSIVSSSASVLIQVPDLSFGAATWSTLNGVTTPVGGATWQTASGNQGLFGFWGSAYQGYGGEAAYNYVTFTNEITTTVSLNFRPSLTEGTLFGVGLNTVLGNRLVGFSNPSSGAGSLGVVAGLVGSNTIYQVVGDGQYANNASGLISLNAGEDNNNLTFTYYATTGLYDLSINGSSLVSGGTLKNSSNATFAPTTSSIVAGGIELYNGASTSDLALGFSLTSVPEPSTFALMMLGGVGIFYLRRRRCA